MSYFSLFVSGCLNISVTMHTVHSHHISSTRRRPIVFHRTAHPRCNLQPKYLPCSVTMTVERRRWFRVACHRGQTRVENTAVAGWRMRHGVCFTSSLESHIRCSAQCSDTRWMRRKNIKETAVTANEFQHLNGLRGLSEIKRWLKRLVFPPHFQRGSPPKRPLPSRASELTITPPQRKLQDHQSQLSTSRVQIVSQANVKTYEALCSLPVAVFLSRERIQGDIYMFLLQEGIMDGLCKQATHRHIHRWSERNTCWSV